VDLGEGAVSDERGTPVFAGERCAGDSHGARPVHLIITMMKWTRTSRLSIKNSLSAGERCAGGGGASHALPCPGYPRPLYAPDPSLWGYNPV